MSPNYQIEIVGAAKRQLRKLSKENQQRILDAIEKLARNPRPHGYKQLEAKENLFRVRVGNYRIVYEIRDAILFVYVLTIAHRREVYR